MATATMTNEEIERQILNRLNFEPSKGTTFTDLLIMLGFQYGRMRTREDGSSISESRLLDQALQRLRKRGVIWFSKLTRGWVTQ